MGAPLLSLHHPRQQLSKPGRVGREHPSGSFPSSYCSHARGACPATVLPPSVGAELGQRGAGPGVDERDWPQQPQEAAQLCPTFSQARDAWCGVGIGWRLFTKSSGRSQSPQTSLFNPSCEQRRGPGVRKRRLSVSDGGARQCSWVQPRRPLGDEARAGKTDRSVGSGSPHLGLLEDSLTWGGGGEECRASLGLGHGELRGQGECSQRPGQPGRRQGLPPACVLRGGSRVS